MPHPLSVSNTEASKPPVAFSFAASCPSLCTQSINAATNVMHDATRMHALIDAPPPTQSINSPTFSGWQSDCWSRTILPSRSAVSDTHSAHAIFPRARPSASYPLLYTVHRHPCTTCPSIHMRCSRCLPSRPVSERMCRYRVAHAMLFARGKDAPYRSAWRSC